MDTQEGNTFDPASLHKYLYAEANPVGNVDPSGNDAGEEVFAASEEVGIGAEEDEAAISIYQTAFRMTIGAGNSVYSSPTLLLKAVTALTAFAVAVVPIFEALSNPNFGTTAGEMPDAAAGHQAAQNANALTLWRDVNGPSRNQFMFDSEKDSDGALSFFDFQWGSKKFNAGFNARRVETQWGQDMGVFLEPELQGIPAAVEIRRYIAAKTDSSARQNRR
jgi:hypothetical protein